MIVGHQEARKNLGDLGGGFYLLRGISGIGKRSLALELARDLAHKVDVLEIESPVRIQAVRRLRTWSLTAPFASSRKIAVVDATQITRAACFALLKLLEEPPRYVSVVLVVCRDNVPATILSRAIRVDFNPLAPSEVREVLQLQGVSGRLADDLSFRCGGSVGVALEMMRNDAVVHSVTVYLQAISKQDYSLLTSTVTLWGKAHIRELARRWALQGDDRAKLLLRGGIFPAALAICLSEAR